MMRIRGLSLFKGEDGDDVRTGDRVSLLHCTEIGSCVNNGVATVYFILRV